MNPASRIWDIPPPPGTEDDELLPINPTIKQERVSPPKQFIPEPEKQNDDAEKSEVIDKKEVIDTSSIKKEPEEPSIEQPVVKKEKERERSKHRSRSRDKYRRRRHSRSRSRDRHRRSTSRSRRRKKRYSSSRSRSRTPSYRRRRRSKHRYSSSRYSRSKSRSRSRSRSKSPSRYRHKSYRSRKDRERSHRSRTSSPHYSNEGPPLDADTNEVDMKIEEDEEDEDTLKDNVFKNDGSFLEMFKKMQEQQQKTQPAAPAPEEIKKPVLPAFGKRRGGKVLKTGMVQKVRQPSSEENATDAWSVYMKEVRRYKEACCDDDSKTRPLVK